MTEHSLYLRRIFGPDALQIQSIQSADLVVGVFDCKNALMPITALDRYTFSLTITPEHTSGHFLGPQTLPAYRMLEMMGMLHLQRRIGLITNAQFKRVVTPNDTIEGRIDEHGYLLTRANKEVVRAQFGFATSGYTPVEMGIALEVAAQTIVANMAMQKDMQETLFYPLILGVRSIQVINPIPSEQVIVIPRTLPSINDRNRFVASAQLLNTRGDLLVSVDDITFEFATEKRIGHYTSMRNF